MRRMKILGFSTSGKYRISCQDDFGFLTPARLNWTMSPEAYNNKDLMGPDKSGELAAEATIYRNWFMSVIMRPETAATIIVSPLERVRPRSWHPMSNEEMRMTSQMLLHSFFLGVPELTIQSELGVITSCSEN